MQRLLRRHLLTAAGLSVILLVSIGCEVVGELIFFYPGEGRCDPETFENHCVGATTTLNCVDVTPGGYGMGVIRRYAAMRVECDPQNVCEMASWGNDAVCVAPPAEPCKGVLTRRCRNGKTEECADVKQLTPMDVDYHDYWVVVDEGCDDVVAEEESPTDDPTNGEEARQPHESAEDSTQSP